MNPNHDDLLRRLGALKDEFSELGLWLCQAGEELQRHGALPRPNLPEKLTAARENFLNFRHELLKWIESLRFPETASQHETASLKECEKLLQAAAKAEAVRRQSLEVLRRATMLAHRKHADFPPLQALQTTVQELHEAISETEIFDLHTDCQALNEGVHPIAVLLTLVENQNKSRENLWIALLRTVHSSLDTALLDAVKNGELLIRPSDSANSSKARNKKAGVKTASSGNPEPPEKPTSYAQATPSSPKPVTKREPAPATRVPASPEPASPTPAAPTPAAPAPVEQPGSSLENTVTNLALATLHAPVAERGTLVQNLIWKLLFEDKLNLAYHLACGAEQLDSAKRPRLPSWLMRALVLSRHLRRADGEIAYLLQEDFAQFQVNSWTSAYPRDLQISLRLLLAAACLRPALLAPACASWPLQALHIEEMEQFSSYIQMLAKVGTELNSLNSQAFKKNKELAPRPDGRKAWSQETNERRLAKKNWLDVGKQRDAVLKELQAFAQRESSLPLLASLRVCSRAVEDVDAVLDPPAELLADESDPNSLLNAGLWRAALPVSESGMPRVAESHATLEGLLGFLAGNEEDASQVLEVQPAAPALRLRPMSHDEVPAVEAHAEVLKHEQGSVEAGGVRDDFFDDFFPKTFRLLWEYLESPSTKNKPRNFEIVNNIRKYTNGLTQSCAIGPVNIPGAHAEDVAELLETWFRSVKARRIGEDAVRKLWNNLGFNTTKITKHTLGNRTWFNVVTSPLADEQRWGVPANGAGAEDFFRIFCIWSRPGESSINEEELIYSTEDSPVGAAVVFLYFGGLSEQQRHNLGQLCREHRRTFIVLDTLLLLYLSSLDKAHWLPATFECTLPFTFLENQ
jgi:hypothetical protein